MSSNKQIKFITFSQEALRKQTRDSEQISKLNRFISISEINLKYLNENHQYYIDKKIELEQELVKLQNSISEFQLQIAKLNRQLDNAKSWNQKPDRDMSLDNQCKDFQAKALKSISVLHDNIAYLNNKIIECDYAGEIAIYNKWINNKPSQILQKWDNIIIQTIKDTESSIVDFYSVKGKEKQCTQLKTRVKLLQKRLTLLDQLSDQKQMASIMKEINFITARITTIELALETRKAVEARSDKLIQSKIYKEYLANEQREIENIYNDNKHNYYHRIYSNTGFLASYCN
jgi:DNA repair exonuclease SbcCD ATPase subunit